jgi:hypothetical protein
MARRKQPETNGNGLSDLQDIYCPGCGGFLGKGKIITGEIYIRCHRCKNWTGISDNQNILAVPGLGIDKKKKKG